MKPEQIQSSNSSDISSFLGELLASAPQTPAAAALGKLQRVYDANIGVSDDSENPALQRLVEFGLLKPFTVDDSLRPFLLKGPYPEADAILRKLGILQPLQRFILSNQPLLPS